MKTISAKIYLLGMLVLPAFISGNAIAYNEHDEAGIATTHDHAEEGQDGEKSPGYVIDSSGGMVVRNSDPDSLCWRTGTWKKEDATMECDPDLVPQPEKIAEAPPPVVAPPEKITFSADALFDFDSATLKSEGELALDSFADKLASLSYDLIIVSGYADRIGNEDYNKKLSIRRAESVKEYLVSNKGIDPDRVFTDGKGEANPVTGDSCHDANKNVLIECLAPDRRVEIEVAGTR